MFWELNSRAEFFIMRQAEPKRGQDFVHSLLQGNGKHNGTNLLVIPENWFVFISNTERAHCGLCRSVGRWTDKKRKPEKERKGERGKGSEAPSGARRDHVVFVCVSTFTHHAVTNK